LAGALQAYRESLTVRQRLASADPSHAGWQRDLSYSQTLIGQVLMKQEQWREALPHLEKSLLIDERIAALDPTNVTWQKDVQVSRRLVAEVRARL
ncbi:MAG: tetratricopeptide repeat-containing protein, partial [Limisphaerales bacterium]